MRCNKSGAGAFYSNLPQNDLTYLLYLLYLPSYVIRSTAVGPPGPKSSVTISIPLRPREFIRAAE